MALTYDFTEIKDEANAQYVQEGDNLYNICVLLMVVGVSKLKTDEDIRVARKRFLEYGLLPRIFGLNDSSRPYLDFDWYEEKANSLPKFKGLSTNVSSMTDAEWHKKLLRLYKENTSNIIRITDKT